jgi:hypothetical protein
VIILGIIADANKSPEQKKVEIGYVFLISKLEYNPSFY